jgi:hypothetical protein
VKTLILIIATGAVLVAVAAPTAGARNGLQCSTSARHSINARSVDPELPIAYQTERNLQSASTCKAKHTHKRHAVTKTNPVPPAASAGVTISDPPTTTGSGCDLAPTGQTVPNPTYAPAGNVAVWACVGQTAAQPSAASSQAPAAPAAAPAASSSPGPTSGYPPASANPLT